MPQRPLKPCGAPACGALIRGQRFCDKHKDRETLAKREHDDRRHSSAKRGYGYRWQKARQRFLAANPLCVKCESEGRVRAATDVDHKIPQRGDTELFWRQSNWQALCHSHHSKKTAKEDSGYGNRARSREGER